MSKLVTYFNDIGAKASARTCSLQGKEFPEMLYELYNMVGSVDLPYGRIFDRDLARPS